jgi:hypothetical protein
MAGVMGCSVVVYHELYLTPQHLATMNYDMPSHVISIIITLLHSLPILGRFLGDVGVSGRVLSQRYPSDMNFSL